MATGLMAKERADKAVSELEGFHKLLAAFTSQWRGLDSFIAEIDKSLALKQEELQVKEKAFEEQNLLASQALDRREAAILAREQSSISKVQQLRDAAVAKYGDSESIDTEKKDAMEEDVNVATGGNDHGDASMTKEETYNGDAPMAESKESPSMDLGGTKETPAVQPQVRVRPQIVSLCESMDGEGLRKYIVDHRKEMDSLQNEITVALHSAIDPARLVLKALEGYNLLELDSNHGKETGRACILLLECLLEVLSDPVLAGEQQAVVVPPTIKEAAKEVAKSWRSKRVATLSSSSDSGSENSLNAQAFLQLLVTFGITSEFEEDELLKLVYAVCHRRQTPALCQALGLKHKMPEFVETLDKDGKQIEALAFAHYFGLMDKVQPASMLKAYLKDVRKTSYDTSRQSTSVKHELLMKELSAVKAVLRIVEECDLAGQYPTDGLERRLEQLENVKADRRKPPFTSKGPTFSKKPRFSGGGGGGFRGGNGTGGPPHAGPASRGQYGGPNTASYAMPNHQAAFDGHSQAAFGSGYGGSPASSLSSSYMYPSEAVYNPAAAPAYPNVPTGYSGYTYPPGVVPQQQPSYQPSYVG